MEGNRGSHAMEASPELAEVLGSEQSALAARDMEGCFDSRCLSTPKAGPAVRPRGPGRKGALGPRAWARARGSRHGGQPYGLARPAAGPEPQNPTPVGHPEPGVMCAERENPKPACPSAQIVARRGAETPTPRPGL